MDHLAILNEEWGMLEKIVSGQKTIESRWYKTKRCPWNQVNIGDAVYFKDSGKPVTAVAKVANVLQFADLSPFKIKEILGRYGQDIGISNDEGETYYNLFRDKKYCILIFLQDSVTIEPFNVDKSGTSCGLQTAWLKLDSINNIRK